MSAAPATLAAGGVLPPGTVTPSRTRGNRGFAEQLLHPGSRVPPDSDSAVYDAALAEAISLGLMTTSGEATNYCQCSACSHVFTTESNFNDHRVRGRCQDPATLGMEPNAKGAFRRPFWGSSERSERRRATKSPAGRRAAYGREIA